MAQRPWLTALLWLSLPTALNLPLLLDPGGTKVLGLAVLVAIILLNAVVIPSASIGRARLLYRQNIKDHCDTTPLIMVAALAIITTYSVFRALGVAFTLSNAVSNSALYMLTPLALVLSFIQAQGKENRQYLLFAVLLSTPVFVAANLVLYAAGFSGGGGAADAMLDERMNQTLGLLGITATRVAFPITAGVNGFGVIAAASALVSGFIALYARGVFRWAAMLLCPATLAAIVLTDARGAAISATMMGIVTLIVLKWPRLLKLNLALIALTPLVPSLGYRFFELANNGTVLSFLIRPGSQGARLGLGTGRGDIWKSILSFFSDFEPIHLIGYGSYGQVDSGASQAYSWVFNEFGGTTASCHNAFLQYLLDAGYVGAAAWLTFMAVLTLQAIKVLQSTDTSRAVKALIASMPLMTVGLSQTEVFGTIYTPEVLLLILSGLVASAFFAHAPLTRRTFHRVDAPTRFQSTLAYPYSEPEQSHA